MPIAEKINELSEKYCSYTAENLSKMVKIPSESLQEKEVAAEIKRQMIEAGFDEVYLDGIGSVVGRIGKGKTVIAIDGHLDTVGVGELSNWDKDPFSGEIDDEFVYGRGTVDQESGIASAITAGRILKELGFDEDVTVYVTATVMEEDCDGLCWKHLIEEENLKPDFVVINEPTNMGVYRGHRGRMEIAVDFKGISCHGSAPERGENAVYMASKFCVEVEKLNERLKVDDFLGKGTVTVTEFTSGSPSLCAVADSAHIHLDRRLTWGETKQSALSEVQAIIDELGFSDRAEVSVLHYDETAYTGKRYGMEKYYPTWKLEADDPLVQLSEDIYRELFNEEPRTDKWTFSTNGIATNGIHGIPTIGFGPGDEVLAHAPNEKCPIEHLKKASAFFALFAYKISELGK